MTFKKLIVIDARGHLIGRLASIIAKEILLGQRVVVVRSELAEISGPIWRNDIKLKMKRHKKNNSNHERGPFIVRQPAALLKRMVEGMIPRKTTRGQAALHRLKCYEGIPHPYDRMKRMVVPNALKVVRIKPGRKCTLLSDLAHKNGWKYKELITTLEEKRKVKSAEYYERKKSQLALRKLATEQAEIPAEAIAILEQYGY